MTDKKKIWIFGPSCELIWEDQIKIGFSNLGYVQD